MKHHIRQKLKKLREAQSIRLKTQKDKKILARLFRFAGFQQAQEIFTYLSHKGEVATDPIIKKYFKKKKIIVPKISGRAVSLYELTKPDLYKNGKFGIREPLHAIPKTEWRKIDVAIIPGIAFDEIGHRIGFGHGYFDRLLKKIHTTTIGLCYEFQMIDKVPSRHYDVPVDYIITERRLIQCQHYKHKIRQSTASLSLKKNARQRGLSLSRRKTM